MKRAHEPCTIDERIDAWIELIEKGLLRMWRGYETQLIVHSVAPELVAEIEDTLRVDGWCFQRNGLGALVGSTEHANTRNLVVVNERFETLYGSVGTPEHTAGLARIVEREAAAVRARQCTVQGCREPGIGGYCDTHRPRGVTERNAYGQRYTPRVSGIFGDDD